MDKSYVMEVEVKDRKLFIGLAKLPPPWTFLNLLEDQHRVIWSYQKLFGGVSCNMNN